VHRTVNHSKMDRLHLMLCHMETCCTMKSKPCSGAPDSAYNRLKKVVWLCQTKTIASGFWRYHDVLVRIGNTSLKKKTHCININTEIIIIYSKYSKSSNAHTSASEALVYLIQEKVYLSHSNLMSNHKLITLPRQQLLSVSIPMCYSQWVIKAMPHGKMLYHDMKTL